MNNDLSQYPRPSVTVDCVVFGYDGEHLSVLLLNRKEAPFANHWTLLGGFLNLEETFETAAERILSQKAGLTGLYLEQLYTFGGLDRDPRGRVLSVSYYALVNPHQFELVVGTMANDLRWCSIDALPALGFDHNHIIDIARRRLAAKVTYQPVGFELLNEQFTITELQDLYERILGESLDRRNFYKKIMASEILKSTGARRTGLKSRPAELFTFDKTRYEQLLTEGFHFKI
ncbi:NUDIX hydrolase [Runella sp.]|uniref:NUDIX hydrolase n=1 Tax=Runella sp. TaxID=1960881 RepID=UPI003D0DA940